MPFLDQARNVLTTDQKTKLKTLEDASKLQDAACEAIFLNLIAPPANTATGPQGRRGFGACYFCLNAKNRTCVDQCHR